MFQGKALKTGLPLRLPPPNAIQTQLFSVYCLVVRRRVNHGPKSAVFGLLFGGGGGPTVSLSLPPPTVNRKQQFGFTPPKQ